MARRYGADKGHKLRTIRDRMTARDLGKMRRKRGGRRKRY